MKTISNLLVRNIIFVCVLFVMTGVLFSFSNSEFKFVQTANKSGNLEKNNNYRGVLDTIKVDSTIWGQYEQMPEFPGGEKALREFIKRNTTFPKKALKQGVGRKVYVNFVITKIGKIEKVRIARGINPILNKEAIRVVRSMPDWKPGKVWRSGKPDGENIKMTYTIPVEFKLK